MKISRKINWFYIKTKIKKIIRSIFYTESFQKMICWIFSLYIKFTHKTSKITFSNKESVEQMIKEKKPFIIALWHSRIMMSPSVVENFFYKIESNRYFYSLSSKHGDGRFVGKVMENFGLVNIYGSSKFGRKSSRGIDIKGFRGIFRALKNQIGIAITPDGPRGPKEKVGGEIIKISSLSKCPIVPFACGYSKFVKLNTWDNFLLPLPFGRICYHFEDPIFFSGESDAKIHQNNLILEEKINLASIEADRISMKS